MSNDKELQEKARTAVALLKNAGVDIGIMGQEESCCGGRAYDMGYKDDFIKTAEKTAKAWKAAGGPAVRIELVEDTTMN